MLKATWCLIYSIPLSILLTVSCRAEASAPGICEGAFNKRAVSTTAQANVLPQLPGPKDRTKKTLTAAVAIKSATWRTGAFLVKQSDTMHSEFSFINYLYDHSSVHILKADRRMLAREQNSVMKIEPTSFNVHVDENVRAAVMKQVFENLSFVLQAYKKEKEWPNAFLQKLVTAAFQYAEYSTYITVKSKSGEIVGSVRFIETPFLQKQWSHGHIDSWDTPSLFSKLHVKASDLPNSELWREIYGSDDIYLTGLDRPATEFHEGYAFIPTPFENILGRRYLRDYTSSGGSAIEPGNFAILRNRDLPLEIRNIAGPTLYYHLARLVQAVPDSHQEASFIGTYASVGGSSDRFYQSLGFGVHETLPARSPQNPTDESWNVLMTGSNGLTEAMRIRLNLDPNFSSEPTARKQFSDFNEFEKP
ncbi:MAG: hypothetical protein EOP05_05035 [Proteobacteria bacterium]|nr:MAG: hypothetical protein EOP05_05035 [Pseudomonadota bacterium]